MTCFFSPYSLTAVYGMRNARKTTSLLASLAACVGVLEARLFGEAQRDVLYGCDVMWCGLIGSFNISSCNVVYLGNSQIPIQNLLIFKYFKN